MSTVATELAAKLEKVRESEDWTYRDLAHQIQTVTHRYRNEDCWRRICLGSTEHPRLTTQNIIRTFLKDYATKKRTGGNGTRPAQKKAS